MNQRQFEFFKNKGNRVGDLVVKRQRIVKRGTWQRCVIGVENSSLRSDTMAKGVSKARRRCVIL